MIVTTSTVDVAAGPEPMRMLLAEPAGNAGRFPGLLLFTDIFALTPSMQRAVVRFASYGFVVGVPEFYHRTEPAGTMIPFADRDHAMSAAGATLAEHFDADTRAALDYLRGHSRVRRGGLGVTGFCIGRHLTVRAALQPGVAASVAFYPTGLHDDSLGGSSDADTLAQAAGGGIKGKIMLGFGAGDPHVPLAAITKIQDAFARSGTAYYISMYDGEHAFMRDEGPRYNPSETDRAYADAIAFLRETLGGIDA